MKKEFVPYQQALALKELGFDESCFAIWSGFDENNFSVTDTVRLYSSEFKINAPQSGCFYINDFNSLRVAAPLYEQAFRWFREKGIYENIIYDWNDEVYRVTIMIQNEDKSCKVIYLKEGDYIKEYKTLEEAELECLKKLIELCKKN
jgi:hypothetical protein